MTITYRSVKGSNLTPAEVDDNFATVVAMINAKAAQGVGIASATLIPPNQLQFQLTDHSYLPPIILPTATFSFRGVWTPSTGYLVNDIFSEGPSGYFVIVQHTSALTFDPHATDGTGHDLYGVLFASPEVVPVDGATGTVLTKSSAADYDLEWNLPTLTGLSDVNVGPPDVGDLLQFDGHQFIYVPPSTVVGAPPNLVDLSDVQASPAPTDGQIVYWNDGDQLFEFEDLKLRTLSDVNPTLNSGPHFGDGLYYDNTTTGGLVWYNKQTFDYHQLTALGYTLSVFDTGKFFDYTNGASTSVTIPTNASVISASGGNGWSPSAIVGFRQQNVGQLTLSPASGVTIQRMPNGKLPKTRSVGSVIWAHTQGGNFWTVYGDLADDPAYPVLSDGQTIDLTLSDNQTFTYTPTANGTFAMASAPFGRRFTIILTTSGTTSYTVGFGGGFNSSGSLVTGTTPARFPPSRSLATAPT